MPGSPIRAFVEPHLGSDDLRRVTLSGGRRGEPSAIRKVVVRPVELRGERRLQVVTYDERRSTTVNVDGGGDPAIVDLLDGPFRHVVVELTGAILEARVTKKGGLVTSRKTVEAGGQPVDLAHDRRKAHPVPAGAPFLEAVGVSAKGRIKPSRQGKYTQINQFIRILDGASSLPGILAAQPVRVVDFGCGNAYLTFGVHHHLTETLGVTTDVVGVDHDAELVARNQARADALGVTGLRFEAGDIASFDPPERPHVVIALHACDTATDDALAAAVRWQADLVLVAPCCHHHVQAQLHGAGVDPAEGLVLRHGLLREHAGDVVTDTARATIMRLLGYDVDVIEFVSPEHTPRNLLIRASRQPGMPVPRHLVEAYTAFTARWRVTPFLAELLEDELAGLELA